MPRASHLLRSLLLLPFAASSLAAQSAADRERLASFRDSIDAVSDSAALAALEASLVNRARIDRDNTVLHLRLGLLNLRLAELGSRGRYEDAGSEFEWASDLEPGWPYPWYGLGLVEAATADSNYGLKTRAQAVFGGDPLTRAVNAFTRAAQADPGFVPAINALVQVVRRQRLNQDPEAALTVVRRAAATTGSENTPLQLARGRLERDLGHYDSAAVAFQRYLDLGGDPELGRFELARSRLAAGDRSAQRLYYQVAAGSDSAVLATMRQDLAIIAGDSGLAIFDSLHGDDRARWLARFWTRRDRADVRDSGARLAEHYRRLFYAERYFRRVPSRRRVQGLQDYRPTQLEFDARGEIYIRHGEPTERVDFPAQCAVSWRYARAGGDLFFHFAPIASPLGAGTPVENNYELVASVLRICRREVFATSRVAQWSDTYRRMINPGPSSVQRVDDQQRIEARRDIDEAVTSDRYELTFRNGIPAYVQAVAVGRGDGGAVVHFAIAVPAESLRADSTAQGLVYRIQSRVSVLDTAGNPITFSVVTRRHRTSQPLRRGDYLTVRDTLTVPPGPIVYRVAVIQDSTRGGVTTPDTATVGRFGFNRDSLAISDLVLGTRRSGLHWVAAPGDTVFFNPLGTWPEGGNLEIYYEIYGLPPGTTYRTELTIRKAGERRAEISLGFNDPSGRDVTRSRRTVDLSRLRRGRYELEVEVTDEGGRTVRRGRGFEVVRN